MFSDIQPATRQLIVRKLVMILLLLGCFFFLPYWYYDIVRWVVSIIAVGLAYSYYKNKDNWQITLFIITVVIFNPIAPLILGRLAWNIIDAVLSFVIILSIIKDMGMDTEAWLKLQRDQIEKGY